jgi:hypothetical protein
MTCAPIKVTKDGELWRVDFGGGIARDYVSEASALAAARAVSEREFRPVDKAY